MADRYWVGGSGTWDASTTTNWSATSGGAGGASAPTSADNVFFNAGSDAGGIFTVTISTGAVCADITAGSLDFTMTLAGTAAWAIYGSMTLPATNFTRTYTGAITFSATTTGKTVITNGVVFASTITFDGIGGGWTLGSAISSTSSYTVTNGSFSTNNYTVYGNSLNSSNSNVRSINLGSSSCEFIGSVPIGLSVITNLTFNAGTYSIVCSGATPTFSGGGLTFYNVSFTSTASSGTTITGANTFNNLSFASIAATGIRFVTFGANQTVNGTLTLGTANTAIRRMFIYSDVVGTPRTITAAAIATLADVDFRDIVAAGASGTWAGTRLGNCLGNSNITFDAGKTVYWNLATGGNFSSTAWATTSGGTPNVNNFPLAQDTIVLENTGLNSGASITQDVAWNIGTINFSARSISALFAFNSNAHSCYGDITFTSSITLSGTGSTRFAKQGGTQSITSAGKTFTQPLNVESATGTLQLADALTTSAAFTLTSGTLALNGFDLTCLTFASNNSNTRLIAFGSNKLVITGNSTTILNITALNLAVSGSRNVYFTYAGSTGTRSVSMVAAGGANETNALNYYITAGSDIFGTGVTSTGVYNNIDFTGFSGTYGNGLRYCYGNMVLSSGMALDSGANATYFAKSSGVQTLTTNGKVLDFPIAKDGAGTLQLQDALTIGSTRTFTLTAGTLDLNNLSLTVGAYSSINSNIRAIAFGTGSINLTASSITSLWRMDTATNFTITGNPTVNLTYNGSVGTRSVAHATVAGGSESNAISFNVIAGSDVVNFALDANKSHIRNLDFTGFSGTAGNLYQNFYGNLTLSTTMLSTTSSTLQMNVVGTGMQLFTFNGKSVDCPIVKSGTGTLQLADALTMGSTRTFTHTVGAIDLNGKTLTVGAFSSAGAVARNIAFNGGSIVDLGAWTASGSNLTTSGVGTISMTSASAKTFAGGGFSYPTLNQGGAGDLTITGANTFTDITNTTQPATVTFPASTTTIVSAFSLAGTAGNLITINSSSAGTRATLNKTTGGALTRSYLSIQDSAATPAQVWFAGSTSTNVSNNTGWVFADLAVTTESTTLTDTQTGTWVFAGAVIETESLTDTANTQVDFYGVDNESITLTDTLSSQAIYVASQIDTQTLSESSVGNAVYPNSTSESVTLTDGTQGLLIFEFQITETTTLTDDQAAIFFFAGAIAELVVLNDVQFSLAIYNSTISETTTISDRQASFGWFPIDTTQNPIWTDINNTQV